MSGPLCCFDDRINSRITEEPDGSSLSVWPYVEIVAVEVFEDANEHEVSISPSQHIIACVDLKYQDVVLEAIKKYAEELKQESRNHLQIFIKKEIPG